MSSIIKTVLDIGTSSIKGVTGELWDNGKKIKVIAFSEVNSSGVKKGTIDDLELVSREIKMVINNLSEAIDQEIKSVSVGVTGTHIQSKTTRVNYQVKNECKKIKEEDMEKLYEEASKKLDEKKTVLKRESYNLRVDESGILKNPVGIEGDNLEGDIHLITGDSEVIAKTIEATNKAGLEVENIILNAYASSKSLLTKSDQKNGVALVDIGEGVTDILIYKNDKLIYTKTIPIGGSNFVDDLTYVSTLNKNLNIDKEAAKIINEKYEKNSNLMIRYETEEGPREIAREFVKKVYDARIMDLLNHVMKAIETSGFKGYLGNGLVLTGGVIKKQGIISAFKTHFNYKVRAGKSFDIKGMSKRDPEYTTVLGILLEIMEEEHFKLKKGETSDEKDQVEERVEGKKSSKKEEVKSKKSSKTSKKSGGFMRYIKELF